MTTTLSPDHILSQTAHRPYPLPTTEWLMFQQWTDLLFAHWAVSPQSLLPMIPKQLELDTFRGQAYIALTPFRMTDIHLRNLPPIPGAGSFLEMNLRTYVRPASTNLRNANTSPGGIFFFSLDASNLPAVLGARLGFGLPYFWSDMSAQSTDNNIHYTSHRRGTDAHVELDYAPTSGLLPQKSPLETFLTERYCLYEIRLGKLLRTNIHHLPWPLQNATATLHTNTLGQHHTLPISRPPDLLHFSKQLNVLIYPPTTR